MRLSQHFGRTLREAPADAVLPSHALIVRAGLGQPLAAGIWTYLPLGWRAMRKIEQILREEMDAAGAEEMQMPVLHPAEIWQATGRWDLYGDALQRVINREGRAFALGATHEDVVTELARREVQSYKDLPRLIYQIQTKVRDEPRARGGLIRLREFTMKDAYSLHTDFDDLDAYYEKVYRAYLNVFARCEVQAIPVEADTGLMGGSASHEFVLPFAEGEDCFVRCTGCDYSANVEIAAFRRDRPGASDLLAAEVVETPGCKTIADLCAFLQIAPEQTLKAVFYTMDSGLPTEETFLVMLRGDLEVNEVKLSQVVSAQSLQAATEDAIRLGIGAEPGYASPLGLKVRKNRQPAGVRVIGDESLPHMSNFVTGANRPGYHTVNANYPRDFEVTEIADVAEAYEGALCARCGAPLRIERAIELGHCFKLGTRYSDAVGVTYLDPKGQARPIVMGSYGIGLDRLLAAIIELHHDAHGIVWPHSIAPFDVHLIALAKSEAISQAAEELYVALRSAGVYVLYDDRGLSPGVMFADADLMGLPMRVTVSSRSLEAGGVEIKWRHEDTRSIVPLEGAAEEITRLLGAI